jgi:ABC-type transport system involved in multi-copper enzyme maturation permease subunit
MSSKITEEVQDRTEQVSGPRGAEMAPSIIRQEEPQLARTIGLCSLVLAVVGADLLCWSVFHVSALRWLFWRWLDLRHIAVDQTRGPLLGFWGTALATVFFAFGLGGMLLHSTLETEQQPRRAYAVFAALWLAGGLVLIVCNLAHLSWAANAFLPGVGCLLLALLFTLGFLRHETDEDWRTTAVRLVLGLGAILAVGGLGFSLISENFLMPNGLLLGLLALVFLWAFVAERGKADDLSYQVGLGTAAIGVAVIVVCLIRAYIIPFFAKTAVGAYMVPSGALLTGVGLLYVLFFVLNWVENRVVVMTRRELSGFFYSPIAYLVLLALTADGWISLLYFVNAAVRGTEREGAVLFEPIIRSFFWGLLPIVAVLIVVPLLTMRTFSEERRTGTLELLLTAPVSEWAVVVSKFLATLALFMLLWVPWLVFLLTVRVEGRPEEFALTPLLSFLIGLLCMGANFVGMGIFFSCVTRNQIIAAVLAFTGMFILLFVYIGHWMLQDYSPGSPWVAVLDHMSFVDLWRSTTEGKLQPQYLIFHLSAAFFWLFLTVKVLEARKWS